MEQQLHESDISRISRARMSRRQLLARAAAIGLGGSLTLGLLSACGDEDDADDADEPAGAGEDESPSADEEAGDDATTEPEDNQSTEDDAGAGTEGGTLRVALIGEPPTLDIHSSTATIIGLITWNIYEPLFAFDDEFQVIPMLAESHEVSDDGLTNTLKLRQGVLFHNGDEMVADDVLASIERWGTLSGLGKNLLEAIEETNIVDEYTIEFTMAQPYGAFVPSLTLNYQGCAIYPKSVIDAAGDEQVTEFIGTGPYRFVERQADQYILVERFDDYVPLSGEPNGYGGGKLQYLDEIRFIPVPDEAARGAGLQSGDFDYLESISPDQYENLQDAPGLEVEILSPNSWNTLVLNWRSPLMENPQIRDAFQAALNHEPMLQASFGEGFYRLDPGLMFQETAWHTTAGEERFNRNDPETARQLLEDAGYDGTPVRFMTTQEYQDHYNTSIVAQQQLEEAGFVVDLQTYDWATVVERRADPEAWDVFTTGISFKPDPVQLVILQLCSWPGWWCSDDSQALLDQLSSESEFEARFEIWEQLQENFYTEVPMIKVGEEAPIVAKAARVRGLSTQSQLGPILWNAWIEE